MCFDDIFILKYATYFPNPRSVNVCGLQFVSLVMELHEKVHVVSYLKQIYSGPKVWDHTEKSGMLSH